MHGIARAFGLGILTVAIALAGGVLIDLFVDGGWEWPQFAMVLLAIGTFILSSYLTTYGLGAPGQVAGYDLANPRDADHIMLEAEARRAAGSFSEYRPEIGAGCAGILGIVPPVAAFLYLVFTYGIESPI